MIASAPSSLAKFNLSSLMSNATTFAPITFLAYCNAKLPNPPTPNTPNHCPGSMPLTFTALYVVTPAQVIDEAAAGSRFSGTLTA